MQQNCVMVYVLLCDVVITLGHLVESVKGNQDDIFHPWVIRNGARKSIYHHSFGILGRLGCSRK
jgi:hypothetical protein